MWFDVCVVSSLAACAAPNWGVASLRRVLCGWPALVGWHFLYVCAFNGFLLWVRIASACPTIAILCNNKAMQHSRKRKCVCVCLCLWWFPALVSDCLCMPNHHVFVPPKREVVYNRKGTGQQPLQQLHRALVFTIAKGRLSLADGIAQRTNFRCTFTNCCNSIFHQSSHSRH